MIENPTAGYEVYKKTPYHQEETRQVLIRFFPEEAEIYNYLQKQGGKAPYIKRLIREDMERAKAAAAAAEEAQGEE